MEIVDFWIVGFIWGNGSITGSGKGGFRLRSKRLDLLEQIRDALCPGRDLLQRTSTDGGISYVLHIPIQHHYVDWMRQHGYEGKLNIERRMPVLDEKEEAEFLRGYFAVHHTQDTFFNRIANHAGERLRFYAAAEILERLNEHLHQQIGATKKKIQQHKGTEGACCVLYYQSKREVPQIMEYLRLHEKNKE
ncbi:hypothetical protein [Ectobacillus ponti]|uniref:Uncharacterized protein n=1 Tax=Ectobacillus ponti TaxID=2961894 RepID=A0AA41X6A5_9BACI|nr:hypothetical protein [Ectobacillus ponti]MCP8969734.1 hypothetical protein [Ectobacillus ponti]